MEFVITRNAMLKELGFVQGVIERKLTIPVLANLLIESVGENTIRLIGTDLDVTIRCDAEAETIKTPGTMCVNARKLFDIVRLLPDSTIRLKKEDNDWASIQCMNFRSKVAGVSRESFPEVASFKSAPLALRGEIFKALIDRTIFAITMEESRYTLNGAKLVIDDQGARMVTTDGHRLAYVFRKDTSRQVDEDTLDALIPKKTLVELVKMAGSFEGDIRMGTDENHIYFESGPRLLISRKLTGQFPNYEMVIPKNNDKVAVLNVGALNQALRRVALMADDRTHAVRFHFAPGELSIVSQSAEEGEASETVEINYEGPETDIGFNAQYVEEFLNVLGDGDVRIEFRDGNGQAELCPVTESEYEYRYVVMPMRL